MPTIIGTLPVTLQNGTTADASQVMSDFNFIVNQVNANAIATGYISPGALVGIQVFTANGTYTPTTGATRAVVEGVGGGAAGGGTAAAGASFTAVGGPGSSGAYGRISIVGGLSSQAVTIGAGGTGSAGAGGASGGNTSFGALMVLPGGNGGAPSGAVSSFPTATAAGGVATGVPTGTGNFLAAIAGQPGSISFAMGVNSALPGHGGSNPLGFGGMGTNTSGTNTAYGNPTGYGAGGAGFTSSNNGSAQSGYAGTAGIVIVYEYA